MARAQDLKSGDHVKAENERYTAADSLCRQNYVKKNGIKKLVVDVATSLTP